MNRYQDKSAAAKKPESEESAEVAELRVQLAKEREAHRISNVEHEAERSFGGLVPRANVAHALAETHKLLELDPKLSVSQAAKEVASKLIGNHPPPVRQSTSARGPETPAERAEASAKLRARLLELGIQPDSWAVNR